MWEVFHKKGLTARKMPIKSKKKNQKVEMNQKNKKNQAKEETKKNDC